MDFLALEQLRINEARLGIPEQSLIVRKEGLVQVVVLLKPLESPVNAQRGTGVATVTGNALLLASQKAKQAIVVPVQLVDGTHLYLNMLPLCKASVFDRRGEESQ